MRPIKFRVWDGEKMHGVSRIDFMAKGYWIEPLDINPQGFLGDRYKALMQFTGLHDKNGLAEIYEGDIIDAEGKLKGNIYESPQIYEEGIDCLIEGMGTEKWRSTESVAMGRGCKYTKQ